MTKQRLARVAAKTGAAVKDTVGTKASDNAVNPADRAAA
jgi:hypothetical protein